MISYNICLSVACDKCYVTSVVSNSFRPRYCSPPGSSVHEILQIRILENSPPKNLPNPGIKARSPALQADSLLSESQCLNDITNSMDMSLSILDEIVKDRETWHAAVHEVAQSRIQLNKSKKTDKDKIVYNLIYMKF